MQQITEDYRREIHDERRVLHYILDEQPPTSRAFQSVESAGIIVRLAEKSSMTSHKQELSVCRFTILGKTHEVSLLTAENAGRSGEDPRA
jgi:hypothetical protein